MLTVMMGRRAKCIDGINPTIYYYKNFHSHMIKSHGWLVQPTPTEVVPCTDGIEYPSLPEVSCLLYSFPFIADLLPFIDH